MASEPRSARGRRTRGHIVAVASGLVAEHGAHATSLDDVCKRASVSKSQLYHYFDDKGDLLRAVVRHNAEQVLRDHETHLDAIDSWDAIANWLDAVVAIEEGSGGLRGCPIGSLVPQLADQDDRARAELLRSFDRWEAPLVAGLQKLRDHGRLRADADPERLAAATMASIQGGLLLAQLRRDPRRMRIALDAALAYLRLHVS
jgi:TetR/AcrR family transcriptional repressor of nem operon